MKIWPFFAAALALSAVPSAARAENSADPAPRGHRPSPVLSFRATNPTR